MASNTQYLEADRESNENDDTSVLLPDSDGKIERSHQWKKKVLVPVATMAALVAAVVLFCRPTYGPGRDLSQLQVDEIEGKNAVNEATKNELLDRHNAYRCMHKVPSMTWDDTIAQNAQSWATKMKGQMVHSPGHLRSNVNGIDYIGENLAWGSMGGKAVDMWYDEIDCTKPKGKVTYFNEGSCATGHYTQVVWKSSTKLGCGVYDKLTVCQYGPGGNMRGQFEDQVPIPQTSAKTCGAPVVPAGISPYLSTLKGHTKVDCNSACKADGQSSMQRMGVSGNSRQTTWTCACSQGNGLKIQCTPGWGHKFQSCKKV